MTKQQIINRNKRTTLNAKNALLQVRGNFYENLKTELTKIGEETIARSRSTKTYQNRTFRGQASHGFAIIEPGTTEEIEFTGKEDSKFSISMSTNHELRLVIYAGMYYLYYVQEVYGFQVLIQEYSRLMTHLIPELKKRVKLR